MSGRRSLFSSLFGFARPGPDGPGWPRPPGALGEAAFLRACTACGDCIEACPHGAIGNLTGGPTPGTPAMNPNVAPCHLCEDTPCISACADGALVPVAPADFVLGVGMVDRERCLPYRGPECGACRTSCPIGALHTELGRPTIDADVCNGCGLCRADCPVWDKAIQIIV